MVQSAIATRHPPDRSPPPSSPAEVPSAKSNEADAKSLLGRERRTAIGVLGAAAGLDGLNPLLSVASRFSSSESPSHEDGSAHDSGVAARKVRHLSALERAWLAGVIDGEGSVGLYRSSDGRRVQIQVANTHRGFIEAVREIVGCGSISPREKRGLHKGRKTVYQFSCKGSERGLRLLDQIIPYLIVKRERAEAIVKELREKPFGRWVAATPEARALQSVRMKESWRDPVMRARRIEGLRRHFASKKGS